MAGAEEIWGHALQTLEGGKAFVLATVINVRGSTPREVGAKMIVRDDGQFGTIGGGCGEAEVFRKARLVLEQRGAPSLHEVDLTGDFEQEEAGTCGGIMDVFVDVWTPEADLPTARRLAEAAEKSLPTALVTLVDAGGRGNGQVGTRAVVDSLHRDESIGQIGLGEPTFEQLAERARAGLGGLFELDQGGGIRPTTRIEPSCAPRIFIDPVAAAQRLIIAGAGHIAQPLATLGSMLGFHVTVIDDRAAFANRERFPMADEIVVRSFGPAIESLKLDKHCYLISVTRGHSFDEEVVHKALQKPPGAFVGMIGSRRRVKATLERLGEKGVPAERLDEVHAPLGVDIGAETPEEIAIAIVAEVIRERRIGRRDPFNLGLKLGRLKSSGH
jgi:xanthine dehydrogenase accessory factor